MTNPRRDHLIAYSKTLLSLITTFSDRDKVQRDSTICLYRGRRVCRYATAHMRKITVRKQHLDRFSRFCRAHGRDQHTQTRHTDTHVDPYINLRDIRLIVIITRAPRWRFFAK